VPGTESTLVSVERRSDGVAVVTLDNPKVNALSSELLRQLHGAARLLTDDPPGAVVVTGSDRVFAAGADITEFGGPAEAKVIGEQFLRALNAVAEIPLALACDFRIASERAKFGQPEILLGIIPGGGATQRLPRLIGAARAKDLIFTGRQVGAAEALSLGLVDEVVAEGEALERAIAKAAELARGPVVAHGLAKRAIDRGLDITLGGGLDLEQELFVKVFETDDARTGVSSFLRDGPGKAEFSGR
jgi:enoyl-CoA hydratase